MATPLVLLPGESLGQRNLAGYSPWGHRVKHHRATDTHTKLRRYLMMQVYTLSTLPPPAGSRIGQAAPGRQDGSPPPLHPFWKSWGLSAYNSWPWANKRLSCLKQNKQNKKQKNKTKEQLGVFFFLSIPNIKKVTKHYL